MGQAALFKNGRLRRTPQSPLFMPCSTLSGSFEDDALPGLDNPPKCSLFVPKWPTEHLP